MTTREKADAAMQTRATQATDRRMAMRRQGYPGQRAVCRVGGHHPRDSDSPPQSERRTQSHAAVRCVAVGCAG